MKLHADCIPCILKVRLSEILRKRLPREEALRIMLKLVNECNEMINLGVDNVTVLATRLFRVVKEELGDRDPYREVKEEANRTGLRLYYELKRRIENLSSDLRLERSLAISLLGNSLDLGVAGYSPPSVNELLNEVNSLKIEKGEHMEALKELNGKLITYLLDNSGEAVLDRLLAEELRKRGARVIAVVKSEPFQNDITISEVEDVKLRDSFDDVVETGTDASSIFLNEISQDLSKLLRETDLVVAKGMAHYEYLTDHEREIGKPILYLLKAKCRPVALSLNVPIGSYVSVLHR